MSNFEEFNPEDFSWAQEHLRGPNILSLHELKVGDIVVPKCVKEKPYTVTEISGVKKNNTLVKVNSIDDSLERYEVYLKSVDTHESPQYGLIFRSNSDIGKSCSFEIVEPKTEITEAEEFNPEDFGWAEDIIKNNPDWHKILMADNPREPMLLDEIRTIMFNPPAEIGDKRFNDVVYFLEDHDYMPIKLEFNNRKTSYIILLKHKFGGSNGSFEVGPELSKDELIDLARSTWSSGWNPNFWYEEFMSRFKKNRMNEAEEFDADDFGWAEEHIKEVGNVMNFTDWSKDLIDEIPSGSTIRITGERDEIEFINQKAKILLTQEEVSKFLPRLSRLQGALILFDKPFSPDLHDGLYTDKALTKEICCDFGCKCYFIDLKDDVVEGYVYPNVPLENFVISEQFDADDFGWAKDVINSRETDWVDLVKFPDFKDVVRKGSKVKITGNQSDVVFNNAEGVILTEEVKGSYDFLVAFDQPIIDEDSGNGTHCGGGLAKNYTKECGCYLLPEAPDRYSAYIPNVGAEAGKCFYFNLTNQLDPMEDPEYFFGKFLVKLENQINESEEFNPDDFGWAEEYLKGRPNIKPGDYFLVNRAQSRLSFDIVAKIVDIVEDSSRSRGTSVDGKLIEGSSYKLAYAKKQVYDSENLPNLTHTLAYIDYWEMGSDRVDLNWANHLIESEYWIPVTEEELVKKFGPEILEGEIEEDSKPIGGLITEGRYDAITGRVVKDIMNIVKETEGDYDEEEDDYENEDQELNGELVELPSDDPEEYYIQEGMEFRVEVTIARSKGIDVFDIDCATAKSEENIILVTIGINPDYEPQVYQQIYYKLQEDIRHEIEHFTQEGPYRISDRPVPPKRGTSRIKDTYKHHKHRVEVPALVSGYYRVAKLKGIPLDIVMKKDLDDEYKRGNLTMREKKDLLKRFIKFAKKRFPTAIYSNNV